MTLPLPLEGLRILAVEQYGAGPFGTMHMAELGAEVIKIEPPGGGDMARQVGPFTFGPDDSHFFQAFNRGKKSVTLNLKHPEGRRVFEALAAGADAVVNNLRGDQPAKLRLAYDDLASVNPRLVCGHLNGYGRSGERAGWPAYDYLLQAEAGWLWMNGEPDSPPTRVGLSIVDYMTGVTFAFAVTAAILGALKSGRGRDIDVSLYDVAMAQLTYPAAWYLNEGYVAERRPRSGHPATVPSELFPAADGWVFVMCITEKFWRALCRILGCPELADDPRFAGFAERRRNRDALVSILDPLFRARSVAAWIERFAGEVPAAPILTLPDALDNPYAAARGAVQRVPHPTIANYRAVANPVRPDGEAAPARPAPPLGADTDTLLEAAGYDAAARSELRRQGAI